MTDLELLTQCRMAEQKRLLSMMRAKAPKRTHTAAKIVMTELLREEVSWMNLTNTKEKNNG